jgi:hypothetical protein
MYRYGIEESSLTKEVGITGKCKKAQNWENYFKILLFLNWLD